MRVLLPAVVDAIIQVPALIDAKQESVPSLTVTVPVGAVGVLPVCERKEKLTVYGCPVTVGSGVSETMVVVVSALLMVMLPVAVPLSTVASALPAPAALAVKVDAAIPSVWMVVSDPDSAPLIALSQLTGRPSNTAIWLVVSDPSLELW